MTTWHGNWSRDEKDVSGVSIWGIDEASALEVPGQGWRGGIVEATSWMGQSGSSTLALWLVDWCFLVPVKRKKK